MPKHEASHQTAERRRIDEAEFPIDGEPVEFFLSKDRIQITPTDATDPNWNVDYIITRPDEFDTEKDTGYKGLRDGESVLLGRMHEHGRFHFPSGVSREHVKITRTGSNVKIEDLGSTNGTWVEDGDKTTEETPARVHPTLTRTLAKPLVSKEVARENVRVAGTSTASERHPERNEDSMFYDAESAAMGVFDGVGGAPGSELASKIASEKVSELVKEIDSTLGRNAAHEAIIGAIEQAHEAIVQEPIPGIATTATVVKVFDNPSGSKFAVIGSVGDSRAYLVRSGEVQNLTRDQAMIPAKTPEDAVKIQAILSEVTDTSNLSDDEYDAFRNRNVITGYLGDNRRPPNVQVTDFELLDGDRIIVTSDGIHDNLTTTEIETIVAQYPDIGQATDALVTAAQLRSRDPDHIRAKADDMTAAILSFE